MQRVKCNPATEMPSAGTEENDYRVGLEEKSMLYLINTKFVEFSKTSVNNSCNDT